MKRYDKLVRDKIPAVLKRRGIKHKTHIANDGEMWFRLRQKLHEEVDEFLKSESPEEMADVLDVIDAMFEFLGLKKKYVESVRKKKARERGKFRDRIILEEAEE